MDIFGVGLGEVVVIVLVILIIGGPKNAVKWSRELGKMIRQGRMLVQQMMREIEKDLGPEGKEIMDATRNLTKGVNEVRSATSPRRLTGQVKNLIESTVEETKATLEEPLKETEAALKEAQGKSPKPKKAKSADANGSKGSDESSSDKYSDWMPKK
jgi:Sec-independent protein translocase protein TatA